MGGGSGGGKWGGEEGGEDGGMTGGAGDRGWGDLSPHQSHHMVTTCAAKSAWNPRKHTKNKELLGGGLMGGVCIGLDSDRAGSRKL